MAAGGELEILAAEQVGVGKEEGGEVDPRHEEEQERHDVDEQRHAEEAKAVGDGRQERRLRPGLVAGERSVRTSTYGGRLRR